MKAKAIFIRDFTTGIRAAAGAEAAADLFFRLSPFKGRGMGKIALAFVYTVSRPDEKVVQRTLSDIIEKVRAPGILKHAIGGLQDREESSLYDATFSRRCRGL